MRNTAFEGNPRIPVLKLLVQWPGFVKYVEFRTELSLNIREMNRPNPLIFFAICAVVDFVFGYIKWHTLGSGIVAIICGLPLTGFLFLCFRTSEKGNHGSGAPRR